MIPPDIDDGFTTEVVPGLYARPMLWEAKQQFKDLTHVEDQYDAVKAYCFGPEELQDNHRPELVQVVLGYTAKEESQDLQDLSNSIELQMLNPFLSEVSCVTCRSYCLDFEKGQVYLGADGHPTPLPRGAKVPCETPLGCLKGHWSEPLGLSVDRWARCWRHYWRTRYRNLQDPIILRNRVLIDWIVLHGRDRRFDPFVGVGSGRGTANDPTQVAPRPGSD